ncbi:MAG: hypothetical protein K2M79_02035 [Muribaculaceae bacterium]|nr:hypothetical protein [Muribaculaceae bacterium]
MKSKLYITVIASVFAALLLSCGESENSRILREADEIIETDPSKSLEILSQAQRQNFSAADSAYYALLYTQAQVKSGVKVLSDSLISVAYDYYRTGNDVDKTIRSNFYEGMVFYDSDEPKKALTLMLEAYERALSSHNNYWTAKSAEILGDIYDTNYNYERALFYSNIVVENYKLAQRSLNERYAICDKAGRLLNNDEYIKAYELIDSLYKVVIIERPLNTSLLDYLYIPYIQSLMHTGRVNEIKQDFFPPFSADASSQEKIYRDILLSKLSRLKDSINMADEYLEKSLLLSPSSGEVVQIRYQQYLNALAGEDYRQAAILADSLLQWQGGKAKEVLSAGVGDVEGEFYAQKMQENNDYARHLKEYLVFLGCVVVIFLVSGFIIFRLYKHKVRAEKEATLATIVALREQVTKLDEESKTEKELHSFKENHSYISDENPYSEILRNLFKEKWATLNMLCNQYYEKGDSEAAQKDILHNIEKELKKLRTPKKLKEIEDATDVYMDGIITRLRMQCPFLKESDITFLTLIISGFSVRAVCLFTGIKYKNFYLKRSRLLARISDSDAPDKELFLHHLS